MVVGKVVGERAGIGDEAADAVRMQILEGDDADFERVAGLGAFDVDGAGERVRAGAAVGDDALDFLERVGNLGIGGARKPEALEAAGNHRLDAHGVSGPDAQDGRYAAGVVAPVNVLGDQLDLVRLGGGEGTPRKGDRQERK